MESLLPKASPSPTPAASQRRQCQPGAVHMRQTSSSASVMNSVPPKSVVMRRPFPNTFGSNSSITKAK